MDSIKPFKIQTFEWICWKDTVHWLRNLEIELMRGKNKKSLALVFLKS